VTARKSFKIHALSKIMILHLKRFSYGNHGSTKVYKPLHFPKELVLSRDLLSSPSTEVIICPTCICKYVFPQHICDIFYGFVGAGMLLCLYIVASVVLIV
jgi:hypothetical protein